MTLAETIIIGAGPAGLSAALELVENGIRPLVLEAGPDVGGIARTVEYNGCCFDIGGHRFFTNIESVDQLWRRMLGPDFTKVKRVSRIFYNNRFFDYPLKTTNALANLGILTSARIISSYLYAQLFPYPHEETFEQWMSNRFGRHLYRLFFKVYTEKVWGVSCSEIQSDWAAQRIKGLSMVSVVTNALFGIRSTKTLTDQFNYPLKGPGMMWHRFQKVVCDAGGEIQLESRVTGFKHNHKRILSLQVQGRKGIKDLALKQVVSSMPITVLVNSFDPLPPDTVLIAASRLSYRALIMVGLILEGGDLFPDQWIYVHDPKVQVGRIQNFRNWSAAMAPSRGDRTNIGMEYFCSRDDATWNLPDKDIVALAASELEKLGLARNCDVVDGLVIRQPGAYPIYDENYRQNLDVIRQYLEGFANLQTVGRNGMHRYNNMDHSMQTGILAARNILGAHHDLWAVNDEDEYLEEARGPRDDEMAPESIVTRVFTRMDKTAFGTAVGTVAGLFLCVATLWLVIKGGPVVGPRMNLLAQFFFGYAVTVKGAVVGLIYGFLGGFCTGWLFAFLRNLFLAIYLYRIRKAAELDSVKDFFDHM